MATTYKAIYKRYNGTDWDTFYFATRADQVAEITAGDDALTRRFVTGAQKTAITTYLTSGFNGADQLFKLDANGDAKGLKNPAYSGIMTAANGGSNSFNLQNNKLLFGYGTPSGSLAKWQIFATGTNLLWQHDIGSGMVTSFGVSPTVFDVGGKRVVSVASPTANTDATNKEYVDNLVASGLTWKAPVKAASIGNVTLAVALNSLDGVTLAAGDRVLLKDQTTTTQRGVYLLDASKIPQKVDADSTIGDTVFVEGGTTNNDSVYHSNATDTWVLVSKTDTYGVISNGGLEKSGTDFGIKDGAVTNAKLGNGIWISKIDNFAMTQELLWSQMTAADGTATASPYNWFRNLTSAIQELRGTANYNTHNTETIAGAYDLAEVKNRTYRGDTAPSTSGYISGDLYFEGVAI